MSSKLPDPTSRNPGLDMFVYQALKQVTGSVRVTHVLDDHLFQEDLSYYPEDEGRKTGTSQPPYAIPATIGTEIRGLICLDGVYEDDYPNSEELFYEYDRRRVEYEVVYRREHAIWLNHSPGKMAPRELTVAYIAYCNKPWMNEHYSSAVIIADFKEHQGSQPEESKE
ncbi:hypothetical protein VTI74DRAFT_4147 [Chaetomium olivicolor]